MLRNGPLRKRTRNDACAMKPVALAAPSDILVIALRRLGDVLLTTPLIRSLRNAYAEAKITVLVFAGTDGILAGNPDIDTVLVMPARPSVTQSLALAARLWRRFDLAISTQTGDRPAFFAWAAARERAGLVAGSAARAAPKARLFARAVASDVTVHRVAELLRLADALGIPRASQVVCPVGSMHAGIGPDRPYAIIHAAPMFRYKRWTHEGWREIAAALARKGMTVIATGSPDPAERRYLDEVWGPNNGLRRLDGALAWPELATLLSGARVYVGPDTSVTHLAAASGCPTVAIYGPSDPRRWGPWPAGGLDESWAAQGTIQRRRNAWLVQKPLPCLPCQHEGCERNLGSYSRCLDELSTQDVLAAVEEALAPRRATPS
jgi:heptosyltransferase-3